MRPLEESPLAAPSEARAVAGARTVAAERRPSFFVIDIVRMLLEIVRSKLCS
jgi:hypothetical protein